jgi:hypothetical protein
VGVLVGGCRIGEVFRRTLRAALQRAYFQPFLRQLDGHEGAGPTEADDDNVDVVVGDV